MNGCNLPFNRRRQPRFIVLKGAMAIVENKYGNIVEINMKGLSFHYRVKEGKPLLSDFSRSKKFTIDITSSFHDFCLTDIPIKITSEREVTPISDFHPPLRKIRCGVEFKKLTVYDLFQLNKFITLSC